MVKNMLVSFFDNSLLIKTQNTAILFAFISNVEIHILQDFLMQI